MKKRWAAWAVAAAVFGWVVWHGTHRVTAPTPLTFQGVGSAESLSLSPDGTLLAVASRTGQTAVFDTATGIQKLILPVKSARMTFSQDGRRLLFVSHSSPSARNGTIQIWDTQTGMSLSQFIVPVAPPGATLSAQPHVAALSADLHWAAVRDPGHCSVYDLATGRRVKLLPAPSSRAGNVLFSHDGRLLAVGSDAAPGGLQLWDTQTWLPLNVPDVKVGPVHSVRFSPDGTRVAAVNSSGLSWWNTRPWKRLGGFRVPKALGEEVGYIYFASDSRHLLVTRIGPSDSVFVVDCATARVTTTLPDQMVETTSRVGGRATTVLLSRPSQMLFYRETHVVWDVMQGKELYRIAIPPSPSAHEVSTLGGDWQWHTTALSADGHVFAAGGYDDGIIHVWRLP